MSGSCVHKNLRWIAEKSSSSSQSGFNPAKTYCTLEDITPEMLENILGSLKPKGLLQPSDMYNYLFHCGISSLKKFGSHLKNRHKEGVKIKARSYFKTTPSPTIKLNPILPPSSMVTLPHNKIVSNAKQTKNEKIADSSTTRAKSQSDLNLLSYDLFQQQNDNDDDNPQVSESSSTCRKSTRKRKPTAKIRDNMLSTPKPVARVRPPKTPFNAEDHPDLVYLHEATKKNLEHYQPHEAASGTIMLDLAIWSRSRS